MKTWTSKESDRPKILKCLGESFLRLPAEYYLVKDNALPTEFAENKLINGFRRPTQWRLKVWKALLNTAFNDIKNFKPERSIGCCAAVIGLHSTNQQILDLIDDEDREILDEISQYMPSVALTDAVEANYEKINKALNFERFSDLVKKEAPEQLGALYQGYGKGINMLSSVASDGRVQVTKETLLTEVYVTMLIFGDYIQELPTVEVVYYFLKSGMEGNMPQDLDTFRRACSRIGFVGASERRRRRRINRQA